MKKLFAIGSLFIFSIYLPAELTSDQIEAIELKVNSMSLSELNERRVNLNQEKSILESNIQSNPSDSTSVTRLKEIVAELSAIKKL